MSSEAPEPVWAIVELMGHVKIAGKLTEEEKFGAKMGRLDIPNGEGFVTQYFGGGSVYRITFVTEEVARIVSQRNKPEPVRSWELPKQLPAATAATETGECEVCGNPIPDGKTICVSCDFDEQ